MPSSCSPASPLPPETVRADAAQRTVRLLVHGWRPETVQGVLVWVRGDERAYMAPDEAALLRAATEGGEADHER